MSNRKRRSDRIMLAIPLRVYGKDPAGSFEEDARSLIINRHGALIQISRSLRTGQTLNVVNLLTRARADFRVVGPVAPQTDRGGEYGVECLQAEKNIWGIQFPPPPEDEAEELRALLECRACHTVALREVSLVEVDVLETAGIISRQCPSCKRVSPWGYVEKEVAMGAPPGESAMLAQAQARIEKGARAVERRRYRRACLQLPVLVRDYYGGVEITKSENISKRGFCFASDKNYYAGQGIIVVCPYSDSDQDIEVRARIIRRQEVQGSQRKLYGVRYDPKGD